MEFVKGRPYFCYVDELLEQFPYVDKDISCDVLVVGGGINGAIANYYLTHAGYDTILIDKAKIGFACTSCATALLEYQLDENALDLKKEYSSEDVISVYKMGLKALDDLDDLIKQIGNKCHYARRDTLMFTQKKSEIQELKDEYEFRKKNGFPVKFLDTENNNFPFEMQAGIVAKNGGAELNPYLFAKQLIEARNKKYSRIFENTEMKSIYQTGGKMHVVTNYGFTITCNKVVASTGFETLPFTPQKLCDKFISYTIVTNPLKGFVWPGKALLQDNSDPYHYIRFTHDNRIIIGGEDVPFSGDVIKDKQAEKKYTALFDFLITLFPQIKDVVQVDYKFCGAFASTSNNVSVTGVSENPNIIYFYGFGANGIINAIFGAKMLLKILKGEQDPLEKFFSPLRDLP